MELKEAQYRATSLALLDSHIYLFEGSFNAQLSPFPNGMAHLRIHNEHEKIQRLQPVCIHWATLKMQHL